MTNKTEKNDNVEKSTSLTLCVFCGASPGNDPAHMKLATQLGADIASRGHKLVYGGGGLGLMGAVARAAHNGGAPVTGVMPNFLKEAEKTVSGIEHEFVETMHERKISMFERADAFIVLPGGIGTLEEAVEILSWLRLNLHVKPVIFLSDTGYWETLLATFHHVVDSGFAGESTREDLLSASSVEAAFAVAMREITEPRHREPLKIDSSKEELKKRV